MAGHGIFYIKQLMMRKIVVSMNVTLDGFIAGPNCELDWHFDSWTIDMATALCEQLSNADTILLGRITYCAMARYWPSKATSLSFPREDIAFAYMMNTYNKVVFSKTLNTSQWNNSRFVKGDLSREVLKLKKQPGKDIIIYGSGILVSALIHLNLIDEYTLWLHPVVLGSGKPLFKPSHGRYGLRLLTTRYFSSGVVSLRYERKA
jgi:dihydrofolate reductase